MATNKITKRLHSAARVGLVGLLVLPFLTLFSRVYAADLSNRSIRLSSPAVSTNVRHTFEFVNPTTSTIGSVLFEYCMSPLINVACVAPVGLDTTTANIASQTGNVGFAIHGSTTTNRLVVSRLPAGSLSVSNSYAFDNVRNPDEANRTYFVRISLYSSDDASGAVIDRGSVAFVTSGGFNIGAYVPPFLIFCVGVTVAPDCSTTTGNLVSFGILSPSTTGLATTQFAAATNDFTGYQIFVNGSTMTSGNNSIPALALPGGSSQGVSQFGMNMRVNNAPIVGSDPTGAGTAVIEPRYNTSNQFTFNNGDILVRSTTTTDFNRFTQSYMVNVDSAQKPGVYATTLLYTALASF